LEKNLSLHYYAEGLFHAAACLRELSFDTLQIVNTLRLPVNDYYAVDLPEDFVDDVMVGVPVGGSYQVVTKNNNLSPLRLAETTGAYTTAADSNTDIETVGVGYFPYALWYYNFNEYGEPTGRFFGAGGGAFQNGYKVVKERRQIQLTSSFTSDSILLMYISDGQSVDAASQISPMAFAAIQSWIAWKKSPNADNPYSPEGVNYGKQRRLLRARLNDLTIPDIKQIMRKEFRATIKN
jgi:hypothetical protein